MLIISASGLLILDHEHITFHDVLLRRMDSDAEELKDTIARVARLVLEREREREAVSAGQVRRARAYLVLRVYDMCTATAV